MTDEPYFLCIWILLDSGLENIWDKVFYKEKTCKGAGISGHRRTSVTKQDNRKNTRLGVKGSRFKFLICY